MANPVTAFDGAEGYGAAAVGGRGGSVVHVTNLNDSGVGSLRWALETLSGPRTVVFDVGGTIGLKSQILVQNGNVTIAGQTAAGEGITIEGARVRIKASDVIIRGVHFRPGDGAEGQEAGDRDGLMIGTTDFTIKNVVVDHNTFSWAIDENVDINGRVQNVSFTNNIVAEGLSNSIHPKGEHSKGMLVSNWDLTDAAADSRITIAKNLFTDNEQRNPEVRAGQDIEIINNYIYNYGLGEKGTVLGGANNGTLVVTADVIGNVYTPGASTRSAKEPVYLDKVAAGSTVTLVDNILTSKALDANGNQAQTTMSRTDQKTAGYTRDYVRTGGSDIAILDSSVVKAYVLANAGAVNGGGHDAVDMRIMTEARTGTGTIINATSQVAGVPVSKAMVVGATDTDRDGMTDWFEDLYGLDKRAADNNGDNDHDGFTNIEEYINGLITGFDLGKTKIGATQAATAAGVSIRASALSSVAEVTNFLAGTAEKIDLSGVIANFAPATQSLTDYVEIAYANGNSYVSVDADGAGAGTIKTLVAVVDGAEVTMADLTASTPVVIPPVVTPPVVVSTPLTYVTGTAGNDTLTIKTQSQRAVETVNGGTDLVVSYVDYRLDANIENLSLKPGAVIGTGNELANKITGNDAANVIDGLTGDDKVYGMNGDDTVYGGAGLDWVEGGAGDDIIYGGTGADTLMGNAGCDSFCFTSGDSIASATAAEDRIADFSSEDRIYLDGALIDFSLMETVTIKTSKYTDAYKAASALVIKGEDFVVVNGNKDSFVFWDHDHNGVIDGGVTMTNAAWTSAAWMAASHNGDVVMV